MIGNLGGRREAGGEARGAEERCSSSERGGDAVLLGECHAR